MAEQLDRVARPGFVYGWGKTASLCCWWSPEAFGHYMSIFPYYQPYLAPFNPRQQQDVFVVVESITTRYTLDKFTLC